MMEARNPREDEPSDEPPIEQKQTKEPQAPFGGDAPNPDVVSDEDPGEPGIGGYGGRDPKTEMPRMPSEPETQDDPHSHSGAPSEQTPEPPASN